MRLRVLSAQRGTQGQATKRTVRATYIFTNGVSIPPASQLRGTMSHVVVSGDTV